MPNESNSFHAQCVHNTMQMHMHDAINLNLSIHPLSHSLCWVDGRRNNVSVNSLAFECLNFQSLVGICSFNFANFAKQQMHAFSSFTKKQMQLLDILFCSNCCVAVQSRHSPISKNFCLHFLIWLAKIQQFAICLAVAEILAFCTWKCAEMACNLLHPMKLLQLVETLECLADSHFGSPETICKPTLNNQNFCHFCTASLVLVFWRAFWKTEKGLVKNSKTLQNGREERGVF